MRKWRITYTETISDEELKEMVEEAGDSDEDNLEDYLWQCLRPEGNEWNVEELMYPHDEE